MPPQNAGAYCPAIRELTDAAPSKLPALTMTSMVNSTTISMADRMTWRLLDEPHVLEALAVGDEAHERRGRKPRRQRRHHEQDGQDGVVPQRERLDDAQQEAGVGGHGEREHDADPREPLRHLLLQYLKNSRRQAPPAYRRR